MNTSKPGKKLSPIIAVHTAEIFGRDPIRYKNLILWVWRHQRLGWPDEAIAQCLVMADAHLDDAPDWFAYLTKILPKAKAKAFEQESDNHKTEVGRLADEFLEFVRQRRAR